LSTRRAVIWTIVAVLVGLIWGLAGKYGWARDLGQWENSPPEVRAWYQSLVQPDSLVSCCGEGDAYWADEYHLDKDGKLIATITDDRDDEPLKRLHVPIGTQYVVPQNKVVDATKQKGNPTGHTVVFLGTTYGADYHTRSILCWVGGGGM
jgi:hypothetical protein